MRKRILTPVIAAIAAISISTPLEAKQTNQEFKCPKAMSWAIQAGFHRLDLPKLDKIVYRESRCRPDAVGYNRRKDGTVWSTDYGLTQINDYSWLRYLRDRGVITKSSQLLEPFTNMKAARELFVYSKKKGLDPWHQWRTGNGSGSVTNAHKS